MSVTIHACGRGGPFRVFPKVTQLFFFSTVLDGTRRKTIESDLPTLSTVFVKGSTIGE